MTNKESINLRLESGLKEAVSKISQSVEGDTRPTDLSKTAQKLIIIGIGAEKSGIQGKVVGPFGILPRPFATASFGGEKVTMGTQLTEDNIEDLKEIFENKKHTAAREALRLGVIMVQAEELDVEGPLGGPRPFAEIEIKDDIVVEESKNILGEIKESM